MIVQQFFVNGIAHSSYLLGGTKTCAIVDPQRDIQVYLDAAADLDMKITHILETHLHADFISGHLDLADVTGAQIVAPASATCKFKHVGVGEGDIIEIDDMNISILEVPGHTPEHIAYVVTDKSRSDDPVGVFCGDALFVGDVGRPDLFPGKAEELASMLYDSLHQKLLKLPDFCEVYPAHGAGSLCGRAMGAKRTSTIGYERLYNSALQIKDRGEFVNSLTSDMPPAPDHFSRCSDINRDGPALVKDLPPLSEAAAAAYQKKMSDDDTILLDVRSYAAYSAHHIPGSYHNDLNGNFATFAGWVLPPDKDIMLIADNRREAMEAKIWLQKVGLDRAATFLDGGMVSWVKAGYPTGHAGLLSAEELHKLVTGDKKIVLVDVRSANEYMSYNIKGSVQIQAPDLRTRHNELDTDMPTILLCSTGNRSSLGASILKRAGFKDVYNVAGGMTGYSAAGYAPECMMCFIPHGPRFSRE
ncbi:MAG: rhodanese-like domain-containing protein [candidate division KSB1 bacterium]|jgi:glyoxylase-like metal-dependent hydrolase (beta-lactamase superfamily II)/rhodanese-related sulfurtransferase|nr:rhodanese-like domain-containing protein [candidate division KSB1 bacterium]